MMEFTNHEDLATSAERFGLAGWYAQDSSGDYLGVLRKSDEEWLIGFMGSDEIKFPITIDRIPK